MLHRVGHFTAKNVPGGWGISSHDNVENPCPHYSPRLGGWGLQLTAALQPPAADFVPYLDQRSLFETISLIKEFNFEIK